MENGDCNNITCEMKHREVCYNIQYNDYCPRMDKDCKLVHPKNRQGKQERKQNPGNCYQKYSRYQEQTGYNNGYNKEDFFSDTAKDHGLWEYLKLG